MSHHWQDKRGYHVACNDVVLDESGNCWVVTDEGGYGTRTTAALCHGISYNTRRDVAVPINLTFKIASRPEAKLCPDSRKVGAEMWWRWWRRDIEPEANRAALARHWKGPQR